MEKENMICTYTDALKYVLSDIDRYECNYSLSLSYLSNV